MVLLFRFVQSTHLAMKITNSLGGLYLPGYSALMIASFVNFRVRCQRQLSTPFSQKLRYQLEISAQGFAPLFILSVVLSYVDWTQWTGAILIAVIEVVLLFWFAYLIRKKQPSWQKKGFVGGLLLLPIASQISNRFGSVIITVIYYYVFVALSEEILFRGYIQSRINSVFGRPRVFLGIPWGFGLVIFSLLFGLWHCGWQPGLLAWPHVLWTTVAGLVFGFVREKSEGLIAPAILHGIMNYGPQAILFYLFWGS